MNKPNFFILGAPKCGTTSMAGWLAGHPNIYMPVKEPHYYNTDQKKRQNIQSAEQYFALFKNASASHKIIAEASVWYLYSKAAVTNILNELKNEEIKFMVMIRNPIEMAYSLHQQLVYSLNEPEKNFKTAWDLQSQRKNGKSVSLFTLNKEDLLYGDVCKLGEQLNRLYNTVDKRLVKVVLMDDVKNNPEQEYKKVLDFLNLSYDGRKDFSALNEAKNRRSFIVANTSKLLALTKKKLGVNKSFGVLKTVEKINTISKPREKLNSEFQKELKAYFRDDVFLLSSLINIDLSHWVNQ